MNATLLLSLLRCWLAGNWAEGRKGAPGLVRVDGHIMKLNHFTDYKQLKLLCRHIAQEDGHQREMGRDSSRVDADVDNHYNNNSRNDNNRCSRTIQT